MKRVYRSWRQLGQGVTSGSAVVPSSSLEYVLQTVLNAGIFPADFMGRQSVGEQRVASTVQEARVSEEGSFVVVSNQAKEAASTMRMCASDKDFLRAVEVVVGTEGLDLLKTGKASLEVTMKPGKKVASFARSRQPQAAV